MAAGHRRFHPRRPLPALRCPCGCASACSQPRLHAYWDCRVARAVRDQLALGLGAAPDRAAVWLLRMPPGEGVDPRAWVLVCLAAVSAMEHGRALLWALWHQARLAGASGADPTALVAHDVAAAAASAVARFWHVLDDFCRSAVVVQWGLPPHHPFIAPSAHASRLRLHLPA